MKCPFYILYILFIKSMNIRDSMCDSTCINYKNKGQRRSRGGRERRGGGERRIIYKRSIDRSLIKIETKGYIISNTRKGLSLNLITLNPNRLTSLSFLFSFCFIFDSFNFTKRFLFFNQMLGVTHEGSQSLVRGR